MAQTGLQLHSKISDDHTLTLSLEEVSVPEPGPNEVVVRVEAAPINPSDLGLLFGPADMSSARASGTAQRPIVMADIPQGRLAMVKARVGQALACGNEGAGEVISAGSSALRKRWSAKPWAWSAAKCIRSIAASISPNACPCSKAQRPSTPRRALSIP